LCETTETFYIHAVARRIQNKHYSIKSLPVRVLTGEMGAANHDRLGTGGAFQIAHEPNRLRFPQDRDKSMDLSVDTAPYSPRTTGKGIAITGVEGTGFTNAEWQNGHGVHGLTV
jgi:hypothetical protein